MRSSYKFRNILGGIGMILSFPTYATCFELSHKLYLKENPNYFRISLIMSIPFIMNIGGLLLFQSV